MYEEYPAWQLALFGSPERLVGGAGSAWGRWNTDEWLKSWQKEAWRRLATEDNELANQRWEQRERINELNNQFKRTILDASLYPKFVRQCYNEDETNRFGHTLGQHFREQMEPSNLRRIKTDWEIYGFSIMVWAVLDDANTNAYNPFLKLRVAPSNETQWINTEMGRIITEIRNGNYHITIGHYSDLLPRLNVLKEKFQEYKLPQEIRIEPDQFHFTRNYNIEFEDNCRICQDWGDLHSLGWFGDRTPHFTLSWNENESEYEPSFWERLEPPDEF